MANRLGKSYSYEELLEFEEGKADLMVMYKVRSSTIQALKNLRSHSRPFYGEKQADKGLLESHETPSQPFKTKWALSTHNSMQYLTR
jgi:hypothetical protein